MTKEEKVSRRDYIKYAGGAVVGVAIGAAGTYLATQAAPAKEVTKTITTTVEKTAPVTTTVQPTVPPTKLNFWVESGPILTLMTHINDGFKKRFPAVDIAIDQMDTTSYQQAIFTRFKAANAPDLAWMWGGLTWVPDLVDAGLIRNMDDYADQFKWRDKVHPGALAYLERNSFFFIPHHGVTYPYFYYNVDLFEKQGWPIPTFEKPFTIDEFLALSKDIKSAGYLGVTAGGKDLWPGEHLVSHLIPGALGPDKTEKFMYAYGAGLTKPGVYKNAEVRWTDPDILLAFDELAKWGKEVMVPDVAALDYSSALTLFVEGKAAMWQDGIWSVSGLRTNIGDKFKFDFMQIPTHKVKCIQAGFFNGWVVPSKTKYPDLCAEWLDYAYSADEELFVGNGLSMIPGTKDVPAEKLTDSFIQAVMRQLSPDLGYYGAPSVFTLMNGKLASEYRRKAGEVQLGLKTPKDALNELEDLSKRISEGG